MKNYFLLVVFVLCASIKAQEVIINVDSATGGRLVIDADEEIMKMINEDELCKKIGGSVSVGNKVTEKKLAVHSSTPDAVCGRRNDIPGFMIKVGEAKSEQDINAMMSEFRAKFPELRVEKSYLRPDWRLLAGDYFKRESGQADLRKIKKSFSTAMLVNWRIYCNRAK